MELSLFFFSQKGNKSDATQLHWRYTVIQTETKSVEEAIAEIPEL
jgi:hypothetical protein